MTEKRGYLLFQVLNIITVISVLLVNTLANTLPLFGVNTGQVSDAYPNFFTPAGYVFSIWFIIYLQAIIFVIYQGRPSQRGENYLQKINFFYFFAGLANIAWIFVFHFSYAGAVLNPLYFLVSVIFLLLVFLMLLLIYLRLRIGTETAHRKDKLAVHLHVSVYLGWISVAAIAGIASAINILIPAIPLETQYLATAAMLFVALLLTLLMIYLRREYGLALVVLWAATGIGVKWFTIPIILYAAIAVDIILILGLLIIPFLKKSNLIQYYKGPE
jgi:benzodiazapine receptor